MAFHYHRKYRDFALIFFARIIRMFSYGILAAVFFDSLFNKGLTTDERRWVKQYAASGDVIVSLVLITQADRLGRVNTLICGALLKIITGLCYSEVSNLTVLIISGYLGVISVAGVEFCPFMSIEQSALSQLVEDCTNDKKQAEKGITQTFGYYNMAGYMSQIFGAMFTKFFIDQCLDNYGYSQQMTLQNVLRIYTLLQVLMLIAYLLLNRDEVQVRQLQQKNLYMRQQPNGFFPPYIYQTKICQLLKWKNLISYTGLKLQSVGAILSLSVLFYIDALGSALIVQPFFSYYYQMKFDIYFGKIIGFWFICNILSGLSGILSHKFTKKLGVVGTMVYAHLPSNILLILIGFTTNPTLSIFLLVCRFCISQINMPASQAYVSMVVPRQERCAANGITNLARSLGFAYGVGMNIYYMNKPISSAQFAYPFLIAGGLKIIYDVITGILFLWGRKKEEEEYQHKLQSNEVVQKSWEQSNC